MQLHKDEDAFMVPGMGAQPVPVKEWVPANDNEPSVGDVCVSNGELCQYDGHDFAPLTVGQCIGLTRPGDPNGCADDLVVGPSAYLRGPHDAEYQRTGPYIATSTGGKFFPLDPRPSEVDIRHIARSQSMTCRYNGSVRRFFSTAEHATLIARSLVREYGKRVALAGLLRDSPEAYTGFGDVVSPMKSEFPFIGEMEDNIYRKAIAPHFGLPPAIPHVVHMADMRIRGNEVANLVPMAWHEEYDNPLPVPMMYWSPAEAEREFLATYTALTGEVV